MAVDTPQRSRRIRRLALAWAAVLASLAVLMVWLYERIDFDDLRCSNSPRTVPLFLAAATAFIIGVVLLVRGPIREYRQRDWSGVALALAAVAGIAFAISTFRFLGEVSAPAICD